MLIVRNVSVNYDGAIIALQGIDMAIGAGGIVALLGPNGAGKTTLLKAIAGMLQFERGEVVSGEILFQNSTLLGRHPADVGAVVTVDRVSVVEQRHRLELPLA